MLRRIMRGIPGHPGNIWIAAFALMGFAAGRWMGAGIMLGIFGPFWLYGAWCRVEPAPGPGEEENK